MIKYQDVIEQITPEQIIELITRLGGELAWRTENYLVFPTICHHQKAVDGSPKLYYYLDSKKFYCYTECGLMSPSDFLEHYYETRGMEYNWYKDVFLVLKDVSNVTEAANIEEKYYSDKDKYTFNDPKQLTIYSDNVLAAFEKVYPPEWLEDGIAKYAMDKYNILYSIPQNKIIIPHYDVKGNLIGIRGRALNEDEVEQYGKYRPVVVGGVQYNHPLSMNLYGLYENKDNINNRKYCVLFESEKSVLQLESFDECSFPNNGLAVCGSNFNKFQLKLLLRTCPNLKEIIIAFDNEEEPGSDKYYCKLRSICKKYSEYVQMSFVYDRQNITNKKDSPTDRGYEKYCQLISTRVLV